MTVLPIVVRELLAASRAGSTYWGRLVAAAVAIGVGGWSLVAWSQLLSSNQAGRAVFQALSFCAFAYCLLLGVWNTADCLSREKRDGTLGLLFLTDLRAYDIVLGKLAATSLSSLYGLIAIVPVMALPLLLGGVPAGEFWRVTLALVNTLFFSLAVGMLVSAFSLHERKAIAWVILLLLLFTGGVPAFGLWYADQVQQKANSDPDFIFLAASPACGLAEASAGGWEYWVSVATVHGLAWLGLVGASLRLPHAWQDRPIGARSTRWSAWWRRLLHGHPANRARLRQRLLAENPFCWLLARHRVQVVLVWGFLVLEGSIWLWLAWKHPEDWLDKPGYITAALLAHTVLKLWLASQAAAQLAQDRSSGALELLLVTPLSVREILNGQRLALQRQFGLPLLIVLLTDALFLLSDARDSDWVTFWLVIMGMLIADAVTLHYVGAWAGLTARNASRATSSAIIRVLVLPWIVFYVGLTLDWTIAALQGQTPVLQSFKGGACIWFVLGLVNDLAWGLWARHNFLTRFREIAAARYAGQVGALERLGQALGLLMGSLLRSRRRLRETAKA